ncbi:MAG: Bug family tripartite tricarboxylate transporter substrate binding protein [bacterium]|nr:tripartite tricarboxylate transporter substrate binding protein [Betaproteobacteria bacterium]
MPTASPPVVTAVPALSVASAAALAAALAAWPQLAPAQPGAWPSRPTRIVVAFPPGGSIDTVARLTGQRLSDALGQPFVVDNRAGAAGIIGTDAVVRAAPDGYTLLMGSAAAISSAPSVYAKLPYDPLRDLAPVALVANQPNVLIVHPSVPARSVKEFIALARARPGTLNYGSSGIGATQHMSAELFAMMTGAQIVHVPYKGGAPAMADLLGGQIDFMFDTAPSSVPMVKAGKVRPLAVTSRDRSKVFPDLPTLDESGLKGYELRGWIGLMAPAAVQREIVLRLNGEVQKMLGADLRARLFDLGLDVAGGSPESFGAFIKADIARYAAIVKAARIPPQ